LSFYPKFGEGPKAYGRKFSEAGRLTQDILELDVQEKKTHDNVWKKRGTLATKINNVLREIETDVAAVIEGDEDVPSTEPYPAQSVKIASTVRFLHKVCAQIL
jgi:hypothetical protein